MHAERSGYPQNQASVTISKDIPWKNLGPDARFEVVHSRVAIRKAPSTSSDAVGVLKCGVVVRGVPYEVNGERWILLEADSRNDNKIQAATAWMLVNGKTVGLGLLLKELPQEAKTCSKQKVNKKFGVATFALG